MQTKKIRKTNSFALSLHPKNKQTTPSYKMWQVATKCTRLCDIGVFINYHTAITYQYNRLISIVLYESITQT